MGDEVRRALIERFYSEIWDAHDRAVAAEILSTEFRFRGSLGPERHGIQGFLSYVDQVRAALGDYRSEILKMVSEGPKVACRMRFSGEHQGRFFDIAPTGRRISWEGAAFFEIPEDRIASLWVLGDVDAVKRQLGARTEMVDLARPEDAAQ